MGKQEVLMVLVLALAPAWVQAADGPQRGEGPLAEQRAAIEEEVANGDRYAHVTPEQLARIHVLFDRMEGILGQRSPEELTDRQKVNLFNAQDELNQLLVGAEAHDREVCRHERRTGRQRKETFCKTVSEREMLGEGSRDYLRAMPTSKM